MCTLQSMREVIDESNFASSEEQCKNKDKCTCTCSTNPSPVSTYREHTPCIIDVHALVGSRVGDPYTDNYFTCIATEVGKHIVAH